MKYTGRVTFVLSFIVSAIAWTSYFYFTSGFNSKSWSWLMVSATIHIGYGIFGWWAGLKYDRLRFHSETDALTHLYNRRYVDQNFRKLMARADKSKGKLNIFLIDINDFKIVNDVHGHDIGDKVIRIISTSLLQSARKIDIVARWGGDEFLLLVPYSKKLHTGKLLHRMEKELQEASRKMEIPISIAIGRAVYPDEATSLNGLIKLADYNMYRCKEEKKAAAKTEETSRAL